MTQEQLSVGLGDELFLPLSAGETLIFWLNAMAREGEPEVMTMERSIQTEWQGTRVWCQANNHLESFAV